MTNKEHLPSHLWSFGSSFKSAEHVCKISINIASDCFYCGIKSERYALEGDEESLGASISRVNFQQMFYSFENHVVSCAENSSREHITWISNFDLKCSWFLRTIIVVSFALTHLHIIYIFLLSGPLFNFIVMPTQAHRPSPSLFFIFFFVSTLHHQHLTFSTNNNIQIVKRLVKMKIGILLIR